MTIIALVPLLVCIAGGLLCLLPVGNADVKKLAFAAFAAGLLVTLLGLSGHTIRIG